MKFNPNSFICCRNLWTHVDGLRSLGGLEGSLDQHMLMCWTWTRWFLLCFPRWQRISYFHSFTCTHSPVWLMTLWRCCPCALERSVFSEFDPQRNTNEKSEFNKPALCYSSLYLMLLTLNSVPINSERWRWSEFNQLWICLLGVKSTWNPREAWVAWIWIQHCVPFSCSQTVWTLQPKSDTLNITLSSNIFCCFLWHPSFKRSETSVWLTACWCFHHVHLEVYRPWLSCF